MFSNAFNWHLETQKAGMNRFCGLQAFGSVLIKKWQISWNKRRKQDKQMPIRIPFSSARINSKRNKIETGMKFRLPCPWQRYTFFSSWWPLFSIAHKNNNLITLYLLFLHSIPISIYSWRDSHKTVSVENQHATATAVDNFEKKTRRTHKHKQRVFTG